MDAGVNKNVIGSHVYMMYACEHALYLEFHGDHTNKVKPDESLRLLFAKGNEHEAAIAGQLDYPEPQYKTGDWESGLRETRKLMKQGVPGIYQAVLLNDNYLGKPDLLRRVDAPCELGDWSYEVGDIKSSRKIKVEQVMQVAFYTYLLEVIQGVRPQEGFIVLGDGTEERFPVDDYYWTLLDLLDEIDEILTGEKKTFFHIRGACDACAWREYCAEVARAQEDISLVFGLTRAQKKLLAPQGIASIHDVAGMDVKKLSRIRGLGEAGLSRLKRQAGVLEANRPLWLGIPAVGSPQQEVYFDMESDPYSGTEYLFGLMLVEGGACDFRYFIARSPEEEEKAFVDFMGFMTNLFNCRKKLLVYHYHHYEPNHIEKLVGRYGGTGLLRKMQDHMVDLLPIIRKNVVLPLSSYSLKHVARFLGFEWRGKEASAVQSVVWYNNYLSDGDHKWLDLIIEYNQDDLRATRVVRDWLKDRA